MENQFSTPIFLGGDNRSGTTLLSTILDSHPHLTMGPELDFKEPVNLGSYIIECCNLLISQDIRVKGEGVSASSGYEFGVQFAKQCHRFGTSFETLKILIEKQINLLGEISSFEDRLTLLNAIGDARREATSTRHWGIKIQKDILQFKQYQAFWPKARFIHLIRDGRDVAASHLYGKRQFPYDSIESAAHGWSELIQTMRNFNSEIVYSISYESIVLHPRETLTQLTKWLNLPWHDNLLNHASLQHSIFENHYLHPSVEGVQKKIFQTSIGRFRRVLSTDEITIFEKIAGEQLSDLGYKLETQ